MSTLVEDEQLRLYEALHGRDGQAEDHIVRHRQIIRDSRIPPAGFRPTPTTQIVGPIKFSDGAGGIADYDDAPFHVTLPNMVGTDVMVRVRLVFQSMAASHIKALAAANTTRRPRHEAAAALGADGQGGAVRDGRGHGQRPRRRAAAQRRRLRVRDGLRPGDGKASRVAGRRV
jgi:hypothetical protein